MDDWSEYREERRKKRWANRDASLKILENHKIAFKLLDSETAHYKVGDFSFWPTTGKFYNVKTGETGRGVMNLIRKK